MRDILQATLTGAEDDARRLVNAELSALPDALRERLIRRLVAGYSRHLLAWMILYELDSREYRYENAEVADRLAFRWSIHPSSTAHTATAASATTSQAGQVTGASA